MADALAATGPQREAAVRAFTQAALHFEGRGVPQDFGRAAQLFRIAADLGHAKAQFNLGLMYARGIGVAADPNEAARWLKSAAAGGEAKAALALQQLAAPAQPPVTAPAQPVAAAPAPRPASAQRAPAPSSTQASASASAPTTASRKLPTWVVPALAGGAAVTLAFVAWPFARATFFPPKDLAELGARCEAGDPYGRRIEFRGTALPAAFKLSAKEACQVAGTMTEQHRAEQNAQLDLLCGTLDGIVREFGGGDYDRAARTLTQRFGANDPQVRPALALIGKCRSSAARAAASEEIRKEIAARNARLAVYSVGQFEHQGRTCRGYLEEFASDQGTKPTQPWGTGYELRGYGDCEQVRIDAKEVFNPVRNPGGRLKGDFYRDALKYDGALPATFSYRGVTYNFVSSRDAAIPPPRDQWAGLPAAWGPGVKVATNTDFNDISSVATRLGKLAVIGGEDDDPLRKAVLLLERKEIAANWDIGLQYVIRLPEADLVLLYEHVGGNAFDPPLELLVLKPDGFERLELKDDRGEQRSPVAVLHDDREARFVSLDPWGGRLVWTYRDGKLAFTERSEGKRPTAALPRHAATDAELLPAFAGIATWHERSLGDLLMARPAVAAKLGKLVPADFDQCFADNHLYRLERTASGAAVLERSGARVHGGVKSLIYLHPSGQAHVILEETDQGCASAQRNRRTGFYYFTDADAASARPKEVDEWLARSRDASERVVWIAGDKAQEILKAAQPRAAPAPVAPRQARAAPRAQADAAGPRFRSDPACQALQSTYNQIANSGTPPQIKERQLRSLLSGRAAQHCMR